jgi:hypothetical protein
MQVIVWQGTLVAIQDSNKNAMFDLSARRYALITVSGSVRQLRYVASLEKCYLVVGKRLKVHTLIPAMMPVIGAQTSDRGRHGVYRGMLDQDGQFTTWYGGQMVASKWYSHGEQHGEDISLGKYGTVQIRNYCHDRLQGVCSFTNEQGQLLSYGVWLDGEEDGLHTKWWANGNTKKTTFWVDGHKSGTSITYYENGRKHTEEDHSEHTGRVLARRIFL